MANNNKIKYALYGLLLRGTIADLLKVFSMGSLEPILNVIAIGLLLLGVIELLKQETRFVCYSTIVFIIIWGVSTLLHRENTIYVKENITQFFIYCLPFMWFGYYFIKHAIFLDTFLPIARIKLVLALIVQVIILIDPSRDVFAGDYQTAAYSIIVGLVSTYYLALRDKKIADIVLSIMGTLVLMICGSRSIFISILFFWIVYLFSHYNNRKKVITLLIIVLIFTLFSFQEIISPIVSIAESLGFSTHLTEALTQGSLFEDENRELLYAGFWGLIWQSPMGYGIMGDRYLSYHTGLFWKPIYPHNIFLELMIDFGYVLGLFLCIALVYFIIRFLFFNENKKYTMTLLVLTCSSFMKLLFCSSFWTDQMFFMLLGALIAKQYVSTDNTF